MRSLILLAIALLPYSLRAQPTLPADIQQKVDAQLKAGGTVEYHVRDRSAEGIGASGQASGEKTDLKVDQTAPVVALPGASASGGDNKASGSAMAATNPLRIMFALGAVAGLGGAAWFVYRKNPRGALFSGAAGTGFAIAAIWPVFAMVSLAAGGLALLAGHFYVEHTHPEARAQARADLRKKLALAEARLGVDLDGDGVVGAPAPATT